MGLVGRREAEIELWKILYHTTPEAAREDLELVREVLDENNYQNHVDHIAEI